MLSCFFRFRECVQPGTSLFKLDEAEISLGKRPPVAWRPAAEADASSPEDGGGLSGLAKRSGGGGGVGELRSQGKRRLLEER
jgi:hypothetical protein